MKKTILMLAIVLVAFLAIGCTQDGGETPVVEEEAPAEETPEDATEELPVDDTETTEDEEEPAGVVVEVAIEDFKFVPESVTITTGDTVMWTNFDSAPHTATGNEGEFDSGTLQTDESFSFTFEEAGSFDYICTIHPSMEGVVIVE
ncbi:plastocyanin [Methanohalophilus levihalophilus]|uniref:cupredoxin domain-containing protein n=1 Tax=Methanohalophilus levihalophilus TaxID=1431282 RepID=UPI001AEB0FA5|nr:cupredoxin family copper-binding protein [Methanohalophilus levihalophilus]MBP2029103.1 plastocyanin [Methanohalophilus levihalophilus]